MTGGLIADARAWAAADPDPATAAELTGLADAAAAGDRGATGELADRFAGRLQFGTAGLRGALGAGPNRMNRAVVLAAASGLTGYLQQATGRPDVTVVIGYDARTGSDVFAADTAAVVTAAGGRALILPRPLPTPVLAYAIRHVGADAGVMVTASHNPAADNGYKVYLGDGSQIVPPVDAGIAAAIDAAPAANRVPRATSGWTTLGDDLLADYLDAAVGVLDPHGSRDLRVVHTAMHGVGWQVALDAFTRAGFPPPIPVGAQQHPDPAFPTLPFPNPEEPGALDLATRLAARVDADLVIANDPDADRCAVAVPDGGTWRMLRGDELGAILGARILQRGVPEGGVLANSIVSSRLLAAMAAAHGVRHQQTLTGFKWISRVPHLVYGYEEAIGYCVDPVHVRDKDGISAALLIAEYAAQLKTRGATLLDVLDDLAATYGAHVTDAYSVRATDPDVIRQILTRLLQHPPTQVGGQPVTACTDLNAGSPDLPPTPGIRLDLADRTRIIVRPSGTEPKLKIYLEAIADTTPAATAALTRARTDLEHLTTP